MARQSTKTAKPKRAFGAREQQWIALRETVERQQSAIEAQNEVMRDMKTQHESEVAALKGRLAGRDADVHELKREIVARDQVIARQLGYIDRALEDDRAREGTFRNVPEISIRAEPIRTGPNDDRPRGDADAYRSTSSRPVTSWFDR